MVLAAGCEVGSASAPSGVATSAHGNVVCEDERTLFRAAEANLDPQIAQRVVLAASERAECFELERVPVAQLALVFDTAARQTIRDLVAEHGNAGGGDRSQAACELYTRVLSNPKFGIARDGGRDLVDVLCAYSDAASGTGSGYLSALTQIEAVRDEKLREATRKDLIVRVYLGRYFLGGPGEGMAALRETYPLSSVADPTSFAAETLIPRLHQSPIPALFFEEQADGERDRREIIRRHFAYQAAYTKRWKTVASMADAYVKAGHDPALVYRVAFDAVMAGKEDFVTARQLAAHLGPAEKRAAVDGRIAQLDAAADFDVLVGPDGRQSHLYRMRDDPAPE